MRYAHGLLMGSLLAGIVCIGSGMIKLAGFGVTDPLVLESLWNVYLVWISISAIVLILPLALGYAFLRSQLKQIFIFEVGGLAFFSPLWFLLIADLTGTPWAYALTDGLNNALPFLGTDGTFLGTDIGPVVLIPGILISMIVGIVFLRPSFAAKYSEGVYLPKKKTTEKTTSEDASGDSIETEMPEIAPPVADEKTERELRELLERIKIPSSVINSIVMAGIKTVADLVGTSLEQIAALTGIDIATARNYHMAVQKEVWFGGI